MGVDRESRTQKGILIHRIRNRWIPAAFRQKELPHHLVAINRTTYYQHGFTNWRGMVGQAVVKQGFVELVWALGMIHLWQ